MYSRALSSDGDMVRVTWEKLSEWVRLQLPLVSSRTELLGNCSLSTESSDWQLLCWLLHSWDSFSLQQIMNTCWGLAWEIMLMKRILQIKAHRITTMVAVASLQWLWFESLSGILSHLKHKQLTLKKDQFGVFKNNILKVLITSKINHCCMLCKLYKPYCIIILI